MVFSSLPFLFLFLTVVLLVSHLLPFKFRNFFLLLANLVFYAYGEPVYVLIMIASILVNFFAGVLMDKQPTQSRRRAVLVVGIVLNLAALGVFKYAGLSPCPSASPSTPSRRCPTSSTCIGMTARPLTTS